MNPKTHTPKHSESSEDQSAGNLAASESPLPVSEMEEREADLAKFFSRVQKTDTCWLWNGGKNRTGYGRFSYRGKNIAAHRFLIAKDIPPGMFACHHCDNPPCVNPAHIFIGTAKDNSDDMRAKGRQCYMDSKLSEEIVIEILKQRDVGAVTLARKYDVSRITIWQIRNGKRWRETHEKFHKQLSQNANLTRIERPNV